MPTVIDKGGRDISDIVISAAILVITVIGLSAALWKLKMFEFLLVRNKGWRHRTSASAPTGGGYSR